MRIYQFSYKGVYLPGVIVVLAPTAAIARRLARKDLLPEHASTLMLDGSDPMPDGYGAVVYNWDGDY